MVGNLSMWGGPGKKVLVWAHPMIHFSLIHPFAIISRVTSRYFFIWSQKEKMLHYIFMPLWDTSKPRFSLLKDWKLLFSLSFFIGYLYFIFIENKEENRFVLLVSFCGSHRLHRFTKSYKFSLSWHEGKVCGTNLRAWNPTNITLSSWWITLLSFLSVFCNFEG